jgi:hypothetical protein
MISAGRIRLADVCSYQAQDAQRMCVDGALWGVLAGVDVSKGLLSHWPGTFRPCLTFPDGSKDRAYCIEVKHAGFYGGHHDFSLYAKEKAVSSVQ